MFIDSLHFLNFIHSVIASMLRHNNLPTLLLLPIKNLRFSCIWGLHAMEESRDDDDDGYKGINIGLKVSLTGVSLMLTLTCTYLLIY